MPFSSLRDPVDLARAHAAVERAWIEIRRRGLAVEGGEEGDRARLAGIVVAMLVLATSDSDLVERTVRRFAARGAAR